MIVVGYSADVFGHAAIEHAIAEAKLRNTSLLVINATEGESYVDPRFAGSGQIVDLETHLADSGVPFEIRQSVGVDPVRELLAAMDRGESLQPPTQLQGLRLGPLALLGSPFEIFQAIKNDVRQRAKSPLPLVMGLTNDGLGYAPDRDCAARGGYAADMVPLMIGMLPYANIHEELVTAFLALEALL